MIVAFPGWRVRRRSGLTRAGLALFVPAALLAACEGASDPAGPPPPSPRGRVRLPERAPQYSFAAGLEERYPEIVAFMRQFLETCLAGDYAGYRRLVTRTADPESRDRFEKILHTLQTLTVETIETGELPETGGPVYLVTSRVEFDPDQRTAQRRGPVRRVAIVVLQEDGEWRMGLAPPEYQPPAEEPAPPASAPADSAPSYPWDQGVDY